MTANMHNGLFVVLHGEGPRTPVLTMHGGLGLDHTYLRPWLDALGADRPVVYYDHRDNGRSVAPDGASSPVDLDALAGDAEALRRSLCLPPIVVVAHSAGAAIAVRYALRFPTSVRALVLSSPVLSAQQIVSAVERHRDRFTTAQRDAFERAFTGRIANDDEFRALWSVIMPLYFASGGDRAAIDAQCAQWVRQVRFRLDPFSRFVASLTASEDETLTSLRGLTLPVLWLDGESDWLWNNLAGRALRGSPNVTHTVFDCCGHYPFAERPDEFLAAVLGWLDSGEPTP